MLGFLKALLFIKGGKHTEFLSLVIFTVELLDCLGGATMSIFNVVFVWWAKADEVKFLIGIFGTLTAVKRGNIAVGTKNIENFLISHVTQIIDE